MQIREKESRHIQILRGLSIMAVVVIHNTPAGMAQVLIRPFLNFCVGMFLFLSGFLSTRESWKPRKRIVKVLVPYIFWSFVYVCVNNLHNLKEIPVEYVKSVILGNASAIMYYIFVYCQFTLLIPVIDKLANSKYKYLGFLISPVEIIAMRTLPVVVGFQYNQYLQLIIHVSCLGWFTFFYLGYLIRNGNITIRLNNTALLVLSGVSILLQVAEGYWLLTLGNANCATQMKISAVLTGVFFVLLGYKFINAPKAYNSKLLCVLGDHSFGIYFSHLAVMAVLQIIPFYEVWVFYPLNVIVTIALSLSLCYIGKRILSKYSWLIAL